MNKKIYFNNSCLCFSSSKAESPINQSISDKQHFKEEELEALISLWMSEAKPVMSGKARETLLHESTFEQVLDYLKKKFYYIEAAGGLIKKENQYLFIFRLGKWDLPKGKLDKEEGPEHAAIRECEEECAIGELKIESQLSSTFHMYKYKDSFAIKQSFWYYMSSTWNQPLIPQIEENIERVEWMKRERIMNDVFANSYYTIKDVVNEAIERKIID